MKQKVIWVLIVTGTILTHSVTADYITGQFSYQGRLFDMEAPAEGVYDLQFGLFNDPDPDPANQIGTNQLIENMTVVNGYFTAQLDFGSFAFNGQQRWLQIAVRPAISTDPNDFETLTPLQELTPVPYAIYSKNAISAINAQQLGGAPASSYAPVDHDHNADQITSGTLSTDRFSALNDLIADSLLDNTAGDLARNNGILQPSLNADMLDGLHAADFADQDHTHAFSDITGMASDTQIPNDITINYAAQAGLALNAKNADTVDGKDASEFAAAAHTHSALHITSGQLSAARFSAYGDLTAEGFLGNASGDLAQNNTILQSKLNADMLDGFHASSFIQDSQDYGRIGVAPTLYENNTPLSSKYVNEGQTNAITATMIANSAVTSAKIADNAISSSKITDNTITPNDIHWSLNYTGDDTNGGLLNLTNINNGSTGNFPVGVSGAANGSPSSSNRTIGVMGAAPGLGFGSPVTSLPFGKIGVAGLSDSGYGVVGVSNDQTAVAGFSTGSTSANNGLYGETNATSTIYAGVRGYSTSSAQGVYGSSTDGYGVRAYSSNNDGIYSQTGASNQHAGYFYSSSGQALNGAVLYANSYNAAGIALFAKNDNSGSTDATAVFSNDGTGYLIKGFGGDGGEHEFAVFNNGKVWAKGGLEVPSGARVITPTLQITGGSDLAENFDIRHPIEHARVQPGMLVCIDPDRPGKLMVSSTPRDRKVAGVISGAGGIQPGMMMGQQKSVADGHSPVALTGRVYCLADASDAPIQPGDLLTTSAVPGHAMKVSNYSQAAGAIIGKAMTGLKSGKGLILVLISLQ